jgi:Bacteriocin-protection, YdeI or OmpD-Associated/Domain of unknown function (DUF1905)
MGHKASTQSSVRTRCVARLMSPLRRSARPETWTFLTLPKEASMQLPSRSMVSIEGSLNGAKIRATLEPDGEGGHWLKVSRKTREEAQAIVGDMVSLDIWPTEQVPEPTLPPDLRRALAASSAQIRATWLDITPMARRDWVHWITSAKRTETRARRIASACEMLAKGKRRPCCFDRSGMHAKNMSSPAAHADRAPR